MSILQDRVTGCIVGGVIGDAMGGPYEGRVGPVDLGTTTAWRGSDDTQFTLATCEAVDDAGRIQIS